MCQDRFHSIRFKRNGNRSLAFARDGKDEEFLQEITFPHRLSFDPEANWVEFSSTSSPDVPGSAIVAAAWKLSFDYQVAMAR